MTTATVDVLCIQRVLAVKQIKEKEREEEEEKNKNFSNFNI